MPSSALSRSRFPGRLPAAGPGWAPSAPPSCPGGPWEFLGAGRPPLGRGSGPRRARRHGPGMLSGPHWAPLFPAPLRTASLCILMGCSPHPLGAPAPASALRPGHPRAGRSAPRPPPKPARGRPEHLRPPRPRPHPPPHPHPGGPAAQVSRCYGPAGSGGPRPPPRDKGRPGLRGGAGGGGGSGGSARPRRPLCGGGGGAWARPPSGARLRAALRPARPPGLPARWQPRRRPTLRVSSGRARPQARPGPRAHRGRGQGPARSGARASQHQHRPRGRGRGPRGPRSAAPARDPLGFPIARRRRVASRAPRRLRRREKFGAGFNRVARGGSRAFPRAVRPRAPVPCAPRRRAAPWSSVGTGARSSAPRRPEHPRPVRLGPAASAGGCGPRPPCAPRRPGTGDWVRRSGHVSLFGTGSREFCFRRGGCPTW